MDYLNPPRLGTRGPKPRPALDRALDRIDMSDPDGCWPASGASHDGYPVLSVGSKADNTKVMLNMMAVVYDAAVGDRGEAEVTDHLCRNRACCNPDHLEAITNEENVMRGQGFAARYARQTHCLRGHEFTPENTYVAVRPGRANSRVCRECVRLRAQARRNRKPSDFDALGV